MRVAVLSSFNVDLLPQRLEKALADTGLSDAEVVLGAFGQIALEALNPSSHALNSEPDVVVVIPAVEDITEISEVRDAVHALLERTAATVYVVAFGSAHLANAHILNPIHLQRGQRAIESFLGRIRDLSGGRVVVVDWDWCYHNNPYFDPRLWYLARMRLNAAGLDALADLIAVHMVANAGIVRKVIAVDFDDTLWGGIIGEDGLSGIMLGEDGLDLAYQDFQRELLKIRETGVLLVACSKNNPEDAYEVFEHHSGTIIRREHFTAERINWDDKAVNLVSLSQELDLGLDSFVFLDDDQHERYRVRTALSEVLVPELPRDPTARPGFLRDLTCFRRISLTQADTERPRAYKSHVARKQAKVGLSLDEYIESLEQKVDIRPIDDGSIGRAAQLCQRTNQFNMTTKRYTVAELQTLLHHENFEAFTVSVSDRFGDSGIIGLAIVNGQAIDTFLLSCRALGRGVEDTLLAFVVAHARERGLRRLVGRYVPTAKNAAAAGFYERSGFVPCTKNTFTLDLVREPSNA